MNFTPIYQIPCPGDEDYAAFALYLKCLAEQLDDLFTEKNNSIEEFRNRYTGVWRNTAPLVSDGLGSFTLAMESTANLFWNDPSNPHSTGTSGSFTDPFRFNLPGDVPGGLYAIGGTCAFNVGATAGSARELSFNAYYSGSQGVTSDLMSLDGTEESNTGGEFLQANFQLPNRVTTLSTGVVGTPIGFYPSGAETSAGTVTIPVGGFTFWATLIGTNELIGGV